MVISLAKIVGLDSRFLGMAVYHQFVGACKQAPLAVEHQRVDNVALFPPLGC